MIENLCIKISNKIANETNKQGEEVAVIKYGLFIIIHTTIGLISAILIGLFIGKLKEIMLIIIVSSTLKRYSGGVHATSPNRCLIIGNIMAVICVYINELFFNINISIIMLLFINSILCYTIFYKKCPVGTKNKPLKNEKNRKILRKKLFFLLNTYTIVSIILIIGVYNNFFNLDYIKAIYCIELGILLQAFALTKVGEKVILKLDYFLTI